MSSTEYAERLHAAVRTIPDFPSPGIQFKDITPILSDGKLLNHAVEALAGPFLDAGITKVVGIEARGFILGCPLARRLDAGFVPVRKHGKLPYTTHTEEYDLEYGTDCVEMHVDAVHEGDRVLVHDDVIATGGTAAASWRLLQSAGAQVVGFSFLVELAFLSGRGLLSDGVPVHSVLYFD
ncbi:MAG: adenine phosphoribosyltransferase [Rhodothermales bacterium]